jgi:predicted ATP-grasp superfamily ATP-dependent carboligase
LTVLKKILILDAMQRSALAATRSLGAKGFYIITADSRQKTLSGASRFSKQSIVCPSPQFETDAFITYIRSVVKQYEIDLIFPMSEITCSVILKNREQFQDVVIPVADFDKFDTLSDKYALFKLAISLGLPVPETHFIAQPTDVDTVLDLIQFPVVLKPARSRIFSNNGWIDTTVAFANSSDELKTLVNQHIYFRDYPFMIQSFIKGIGQGLFALYKEGEPVCFFSHKRIKEKPPEGGASVLSESVEATPAMLHSATTLLNHVDWEGVAMVEFKVSPDGTPYLMEINARFWGSLQLAIDSGVDFPYLLYQVYSGEDIKPLVDYKKGIKLRWLFGDLDRLIIIFKNPDLSLSNKLKEFINFCKFFQPGMRYEINRLNDLKPFMFEFWEYIKVNLLRT